MAAGDWKDMFLAACDGDVELVRCYVEKGWTSTTRPELQSTALVACLLAGHERAATFADTFDLTAPRGTLQ